MSAINQYTLRGVAACLVMMTIASAATAAPHVLNNGPGDASVSVGVDGFGAFGSSVGSDATDATYDPVGAGTPAGTVYESGIAIGQGGARSFLTSGDIGGSGSLANPTVTGDATNAVSSFTALSGALSISLTQTLTPILDNSSIQIGSRLTQTYSLQNISDGPLAFEFIRYIDGDLLFDGSLVDGGGRLVGPPETLFEIDSATGALDPTTLLGITATGGTTPAAGRYEADSFSGLRGRIITGTGLDDTIASDGADADQFVDAGFGYDITLAFRNSFSLGAGESSSYQTTTVWGSTTPDAIAPAGVPEPATFVLAAVGMVSMGLVTWHRRRRRG